MRFTTKIIFKLLAFSLIWFSIASCSTHYQLNNLDAWVGDYRYDETPIRAIAGYAMVMTWDFSISKHNDSCTGVLEVNGQQTFMKLKTTLEGDTSNLAVIYDGLIDGMEGIAGQLKNGDTLLTLTKTAQGLKTTWFSLEPRLPANSPKVCNCFIRFDKGK